MTASERDTAPERDAPEAAMRVADALEEMAFHSAYPGTRSILNRAAALLRAGRPAAPGWQAKAKPLEWRPYGVGGKFIAETPFGEYVAVVNGPWWCPTDEAPSSTEGGLEAAQADFASRLAACIEPAPSEAGWRDEDPDDAWAVLKALRDSGWMVAVHNDYRLNGQAMTFWLLTHPCGRWIKGEGISDEAALLAALRQTGDEPAPPPASPEPQTAPAPPVDQRSGRYRPHDATLGRFNNHPDPLTDFLMEVEGLEARVFDRERGISKPGTTPEPWAEIERDVANALNSTMATPEGREGKQRLWALSDRAKRAQEPQTAPASEDVRAARFVSDDPEQPCLWPDCGGHCLGCEPAPASDPVRSAAEASRLRIEIASLTGHWISTGQAMEALRAALAQNGGEERGASVPTRGNQHQEE